MGVYRNIPHMQHQPVCKDQAHQRAFSTWWVLNITSAIPRPLIKLSCHNANWELSCVKHPLLGENVFAHLNHLNSSCCILLILSSHSFASLNAEFFRANAVFFGFFLFFPSFASALPWTAHDLVLSFNCCCNMNFNSSWSPDAFRICSTRQGQGHWSYRPVIPGP